MSPHATAGSTAAASASWSTALIGTACAALLALLHLPWPLDQDSTLFMSMAQEMADGARLYVDFWDMKQPGIYWWYFAAGKAFGFDALGMRWMDVAWAIATALVVWSTVRRRGTAIAVLAPVLAFAPFYARAGSGHLSQVEWIIGLPLFVVVACLVRPRRGGWPSALIGAMLAVIALLKTFLLIVPAVVLCVALVQSRSGITGNLRWRAVRVAAPMALGFAACLGLGLLWTAHQGTLAQLYWVTFVLPGKMTSEYAHNPWRLLLHGYRWFLMGTWFLWPCAAWAAWQGWRRRSLLELLCVGWFASACAAISLQLLSFWEYHFALLFIPFGVLAAIGGVGLFDKLRGRPLPRPAWRRVAVVWAACGAVALVWPLGMKVRHVAAAWPFDPAHRDAFLATVDDRWPVMLASAAAVRSLVPLREGDRVTIWGDQRLHTALGHRPVPLIDGDTFYLAEQMREVSDVLRRTRPPLVYLSNRREKIDANGDYVFPRTVRELYLPVSEDDYGIWYKLRDPAAGS